MKDSIDNSIVITKDGSPTIMSGRFGVTYHSIHGAIQESEHVFIEAGLLHLVNQGKSHLRVFEMGFGTGTNAWLTASFASENGLSVDYFSVEKYPLNIKQVESFSESLKNTDPLFEQMHTAPWGESVELGRHFNLTKLLGSILEVNIPKDIDLIYYDAFAPSAQPELWTVEVFRKLMRDMNNGAVLVTYCCKGDVRRAMQSAGFHVEKIPGPPGKREMIRATVPLS